MTNSEIDYDKYNRQVVEDFLDSYEEIEEKEVILSEGFDITFWNDLTNKQKLELNNVYSIFVTQIRQLEAQIEGLTEAVCYWRDDYV